MLPEKHVLLEDDPCPVADQMLGEMYRASVHGLNILIATVPPASRALLAVYCYRRAHLASIGLAIAASCEEDELTSLGGNAGAALFERSREAPRPSLADVRAGGRRKITLATQTFSPLGPVAEEENWSRQIHKSARSRLSSKVNLQGAPARIKPQPMREMPFFVYVLGNRRDNDRRTYVGWTTDVTRRLQQHNAGLGAKSTRGRRWVLLYSEICKSRSEAMSREWHIKRDRSFRATLREAL